jgi:actin-related protein 8
MRSIKFEMIEVLKDANKLGHSEYMKRDDQILPLRLQAEANRDKMIQNAKDRDRALARTGNTDVPGPLPEENGDEDGFVGNDGFDASRIIIIHPGSQNMRIGFASDALPKTIPMVAALLWPDTESESADPLPRRQQDSGTPEQQFGEEFAKKYVKQSNDLKVDMRANKRKVLPNSKELVVNYNRRTPPEKIPEHNDPVRIEWTDHTTGELFTGVAAQRIMDDSNPKFRCFRPIQHGWLNEQDPEVRSTEFLRILIDDILSKTFKDELGIAKISDLKKYSVVFVIPDLYDRKYVEEILELFMKEYEVDKISFLQESLAASFGAGYSNACIVDVGAQKTSIACVEDGMIIEDSRINLKYGGYDVTETFIKMMLFDNFPYDEINLQRRYDFLLAEELKINFCTMNQADISVQLYNFHLRAPNQPTRKYNFKTYDEVILAPMGFYDPSTFDNSKKLEGRRRLIDRSYNVYDPDVPDDPQSAAQTELLTKIKPSLAFNNTTATNGGEVSTPAKEKPQPFNLLSRFDSDAIGNNLTPGTSAAGSPAPEGSNTPNPHLNGNGNGNTDSPGPSAFQFGGGSPAPPNMFGNKSQKEMAIERDTVLPIAPLDTAIITSIQHAARGDEKKIRDLFGGIMVIGGGAKTPSFGPFLEERLKLKRPDLADKILVGTSPREMDGQVVTWKGASVFGKLVVTNDTWITKPEFERLRSRVLHHKVHWAW